MEGTLEHALQEGKLRRQINALIVAHLRGDNLNQAAAAVATATMTPLTTDVSNNRLLELVSKGLIAERDEGLKGISSSTPLDATKGLSSVPVVASGIDFGAMQDMKGSSKNFPKHESRHVSEHKNMARCARFSPDGQYFATGSSDFSIKLFEVSKIKQMLAADSREVPIRPVIRTFYDHLEPINDLDFHPQGTILISGAKDNTINYIYEAEEEKLWRKIARVQLTREKVKRGEGLLVWLPTQLSQSRLLQVQYAAGLTLPVFFDFSKTVARKAFRVIQDTHNVRSVSFHPSGEFILAGTDHPVPHLYDVNTFQCYLSANFQDLNTNSAINQVRYSSSGSLYVTASKDGSVLVWDGVTAQSVRSIIGAHGSAEATCASFTKDQRFVLSCGKDSTIKLWEVGTGRLVKQYLGAVHTQLRCQASFNETEEFILSIDESNNEVVIWDALSGEKAGRWHSNHVGLPRWIEHSPTETAFVTCGTDRSVRYWREMF